MTGARGDVPVDLKDFVARIRSVTDKNLAVGFGISTPQHVQQVRGGGRVTGWDVYQCGMNGCVAHRLLLTYTNVGLDFPSP